MNNALLWALWPANQVGYRCVAWMRADRGGMMHKWFDTTDAAIRFIDAIDKAEGIGAVYHACSLFDKAKVLAIQSSTGSKFKGRDQDAVLTVNSLWVDIDVKKSTGPNPNSYTSISDAAAAAKAFISQHFVPPSFVVNSGGGLHLYWTLDAPLAPDDWFVLASRLKALMQSAGFKADPTRTADAASVLRPPGTRNRKYDPPVTVTEADRGHRYPASKLAELLQHVTSTEIRSTGRSHVEKTNLNDDLISPPPPSSFKGVVSRCQQIRASVATLGANDSEPMWVAMLATVSKCEKVTDAVLHRISSGHPGYDLTAAQTKIDHARSLLPHLCERFDDANPGGCDGCQYRGKVKSPIRLGEAQFDPPAVPVNATQPAAFVQAQFDVPIPKHTHSHQFSIHTVDGVDTLHFSVREKDDEGNWVWSPHVPFSHVLYMPVRFERNRINGQTEGVYRFKQPKDLDVYEKAAPFSITSDPRALMTFLAGAGIAAGIGRKAVKDAHIAYNNLWWAQLQSEAASTSMTNTFGWVDSADGERLAFVAAMQYNVDGTIVEPSLSGNAAVEREYVRIKGSLDEWKKAAAIVCRPRMQPQLMVLLASTFGPFFAATGCEHNLPAICFRSQQSGTGKTTSMKLGLSVWMNPDRISTKNDSAAAKSRTLIARKDLPVLFDEMTTAEPELIAQLAYDIPNGILRSTSSQDGRLQVPERTRTTVLMTTNTSLRGLIEQALKGEKEAAQSRLVEIDLDVDKALEQELISNNPFMLIRNNYGVAGDWWARFMLGAMDGTNRMGEFSARIHAAQERVKKTLKDPNSDRYFAALAATVLVGAKYMAETGFLPVNEADFERYILHILMPDHVDQRVEDLTDNLSYLAAGLHANIGAVVAIKTRRPFKNITIGNVTQRVRAGVVDIAETDPPRDRFRSKTIVARWETFFDYEKLSPVSVKRETRLLVSKQWLKEWLNDQRVDFRRFIADAKACGFLVPYGGEDNMKPVARNQDRGRVSLVAGYMDHAQLVDTLQFNPLAHASTREQHAEFVDSVVPLKSALQELVDSAS